MNAQTKIAAEDRESFTDEQVNRFWARVSRGDKTECWIWEGPQTGSGYGRFNIKFNQMKAHRVAYAIECGPIPSGKVLDHTCRNRLCVNPNHLRPVSIGENVLAEGSQSRSAINAAKTHCSQGHPYSPDNTYIGKKGERNCRACNRERGRDLRGCLTGDPEVNHFQSYSAYQREREAHHATYDRLLRANTLLRLALANGGTIKDAEAVHAFLRECGR